MSTILISRLGYSLVADADPSPQQPPAPVHPVASSGRHARKDSKPIGITNGLSPARGRAIPSQAVYWGTWAMAATGAAFFIFWRELGHGGGGAVLAASPVIGGGTEGGGVTGTALATWIGMGMGETPWLAFLVLAMGAGVACWYALRFPGQHGQDHPTSGNVVTALLALLGAAGAVDGASDPTAGLPLFSVCMAAGSSLWVLGEVMPQGAIKPVVKATWPLLAILGLALLALRWQ